jgi:hypothetical protein
MIRFSFAPAYVWQNMYCCDPAECGQAIDLHRSYIARKVFLLSAISFEDLAYHVGVLRLLVLLENIVG